MNGQADPRIGRIGIDHDNRGLLTYLWITEKGQMALADTANLMRVAIQFLTGMTASELADELEGVARQIRAGVPGSRITFNYDLFTPEKLNAPALARSWREIQPDETPDQYRERLFKIYAAAMDNADPALFFPEMHGAPAPESLNP